MTNDSTKTRLIVPALGPLYASLSRWSYPMIRFFTGLMLVTPSRVRVNDVIAEARDGVTITEETEITITALEDAEILLADVP